MQKGFTLIELVMVIAIIGILAVIAVPSFNPASHSVEYQTRRILDDIRYTQAMSITTGQRYRWVELSSTTYQILNQSGSPIVLGSGSTTQTLSNGSVFGSFTNLPGNLVAFDSLGAPYTTSAIPGTALASTASLTISGGGQTRTITIAPQTGFGALQ